MSRIFFIPFFIVLLVGITSSGLATNIPTIELNTAVHFLTPGGEVVLLQPGTYEVEATDTGLKLLLEGKPRMDAILLEATVGDHEETLETLAARYKPAEDQEDVSHLAVLLPDGTGLEAVGTVSGIRPRGTALAFLRSKMPSRSPKTSLSGSPTISFTKPIDCGPYSKDIGGQEGNKAPALAVFQNKLHMIVNKYNRPSIPSHSRYFYPEPPLQHWVYGNGQWTRNQGYPGTSKKGVALAVFGNRLHKVQLGRSSNQLFHNTYDGREWTKNEKIPKQKSDYRPALAVYQGILHMVRVGESSKDVWHSTNRGRGWTVPRKTGITSFNGPALALSPMGFRRPLLHMVTTIPAGSSISSKMKVMFLSAFGDNRWSSGKKIPKQYTLLTPSLVSTPSRSEKWLQLIYSGKSSEELRHILYGPNQQGPRGRTIEWFDEKSLLNKKSDTPPPVTFFQGCWHMVTVKNDRLLHTTFSTNQIHPRAR